jgi:uncharacterized membrane protein YvlD (DUF360 family)
MAVNLFGVGFYVVGFWSAFFAALIVSLVSVFLEPSGQRRDRKGLTTLAED